MNVDSQIIYEKSGVLAYVFIISKSGEVKNFHHTQRDVDIDGITFEMHMEFVNDYFAGDTIVTARMS